MQIFEEINLSNHLCVSFDYYIWITFGKYTLI